jgi:hypothetical protein
LVRDCCSVVACTRGLWYFCVTRIPGAVAWLRDYNFHVDKYKNSRQAKTDWTLIEQNGKMNVIILMHLSYNINNRTENGSTFNIG